MEVSASFGDDVWEAGNFGQTMYAIKTRNGDLYFKIKKMYGDLSAFEVRHHALGDLTFLPAKADFAPFLLVQYALPSCGELSADTMPLYKLWNYYPEDQSLLVSASPLMATQEDSVSEAEKQFKRERGGGNYGAGTKELQMMNFKAKQEKEAKRKGLFASGLDKFNKKDIQGVCTHRLQLNRALFAERSELELKIFGRFRGIRR